MSGTTWYGRCSAMIIVLGIVVTVGGMSFSGQQPEATEESQAMEINTIIHADVFLRKFKGCPVELYVNDISDAIMLKDPQTGMEIDYQYERTDGDSFVILNFPVFDTRPGEAAEIDLWLDTGALDQNVQEGLLLLSVWIHEDSVFKIIRHVVEEQVLQINISG